MISALLFDLDGTLVDADHLHYEAWRRIVEPFGLTLGLDRYKNEVMGFANSIILGRMLPQLSSEEGLALVDEKEVLFRKLALELEPAPGLVDFLDWLDQVGIRYGIVTNAPRLNVAQQLAGIGLADRFGIVVFGDELEHAKPHPMPYLVGLQSFGASATDSIAFEDSLSGIQSAKAAGLMVVGLTTGLSAERLLAEGVDLAIADFADPRLRALVTARTGIGAV